MRTDLHGIGTELAQTRTGRVATVILVPTTVATPWGNATLVDEVRVQQRAGDRRFSSLVQLLQSKDGDLLVRFAYATNGAARRGPVTLRARDLERLRAAVRERPQLTEVLGM
jgi:hypothetical protein